MKSYKMSHAGFGNADESDLMKKAVKLTPNKKSGKDKHTLYRGLSQMDDEDDDDFDTYTKRESILDYYDDVEDDDLEDDEDDYPEDEYLEEE